MKKLIDAKGRIFGRINIIDFLILFGIFVLIPGFYAGQKYMREFSTGIEWYNRDNYVMFYKIQRKCPNCGTTLGIPRVKKGTPLSEVFPYTMTCTYCGAEATFKK